MRFRILIVTFGVISLFSCKKEKEKVDVEFTLKYTGKTPFGRNYVVDNSKTKILFSNFIFTTASGKDTLVKDVFLYRPGKSSSFSFTAPEGEYTSFRFAFGLDTAMNNKIPASFEASHPLSVETGLYWDMLKYRFLIVEGSIDNSATKDQTPNAPFSMHLGRDTLYQEILVSGVPRNGSKVTIELDEDRLMSLDSDPFKITNFSNHSEDADVPNIISIRNAFVNSIRTTVTP